jgi:hypothetical protein
MKPDLILGEEIVIKSKLFRTGVGRKRFWKCNPLTESRGAVWIGYRILHNGFLDDECEFQSTEYFIAYLVVLDPQRNPILVHPDDIIRIPK